MPIEFAKQYVKDEYKKRSKKIKSDLKSDANKILKGKIASLKQSPDFIGPMPKRSPIGNLSKSGKTAVIGGLIGAGGLAAHKIKKGIQSSFDKAKEAAGTLKEIGKDETSNNSGKTAIVIGGTAAAIGGGLALKKYLKNRKKKGT